MQYPFRQGRFCRYLRLSPRSEAVRAQGGCQRRDRAADTDAGWTRFLLDSYGIAFRTLRPGQLAETDLARELDVLLFPDRVLALTWDDGPDLGTLREEQAQNARFALVPDRDMAGARGAALAAVKENLRFKMEKNYFVTNLNYFLVGAGLTLAILAVIVLIISLIQGRGVAV